MVVPGDARLLNEGLLEILRGADDDPRVARVLREVQATVARGKSAAAEVQSGPGRQAKRESVRRVLPLSDLEQLELLVRALELALITPIDLAQSAMTGLAVADEPSPHLRFEVDSAASEGIAEDRVPGTTASQVVEPIVITAVDVQLATDAVAPLRAALAAIRQGLEA